MNLIVKKIIVKRLADAFVTEPLPLTVACDPCCLQANTPHRTGTNLMSLHETEAMFEKIVDRVFEQLKNEGLL